MSAHRGDGDLDHAVAVMQGTTNAVEQQFLDTIGVVFISGIGAVEDRFDPFVLRDRRELIVVMTEDDPAVVPKIGDIVSA